MVVPKIMRKKKRMEPGHIAGTIVIDPNAPKPSIRMLSYNANEVVEQQISRVGELKHAFCSDKVFWIQVEGLGDEEILKEVREVFGLHALALEDVVNLHQRAKVEEYETHLYIVARVPSTDGKLHTQQLSIFLGRTYVLTFQERPGPLLDKIRERIRQKIGLLRTKGPDFLAYAILDLVTDLYFPLLEEMGERMDDLELDILADKNRDAVTHIHAVKQDLMHLRRAVWPSRETIGQLQRDQFDFFQPATEIYLRDVYDHTVQLMDLLEIYRELASDLMDIHLSNASQRLNEVMKILTLISVIFMPLGFIASVYGMNFDPAASPWNMPELHWRYGYPYALGLMLVVVMGFFALFRVLGWMGSKK
ncbi:magnesium/cobalt transporter CorA [soil metagenome]